MKRSFLLPSVLTDIAILSKNSPMTDSLRTLLVAADYYSTIAGDARSEIRSALRFPVVAATDPWSEIEYQSLYLTDTDPDNRIILQEPSVKDPMVGVMVLKAARLQGQSGMVFCGSPDVLKAFKEKLPEYENLGEDLDEKEFLECLLEAALQDGLKIIYHQLSEEHGGEVEDYD